MPNIKDSTEALNIRLGSDIKFPIEGAVETVKGLDTLLQDIQQLLLTVPGERIFRPDYGCTLRTFVWENIQMVANEGVNSIRNSLDRYEPRIEVINISSSVNENSGLVTFNILFTVKETDDVVNLVFPFRADTQLSFA